jgi:peptidoglycan hydrolase FlgJ
MMAVHHPPLTLREGVGGRGRPAWAAGGSYRTTPPPGPLLQGEGGTSRAVWAVGGTHRTTPPPFLDPRRASNPQGEGEPHQPSIATTAALAKSARDFEAMAIGKLLAPMFATVDTTHGAFGGGEAEAAWKPMLVDAIAEQVAARGGFGFAGPVFRALLRAQETQSGTTSP